MSVKKKIHNNLINQLSNFRVKKVYLAFKNCLDNYNQKKVCIAISGGSDSMALAFLAKSYSIKKKIKFFYCIVDHKLRNESKKETQLVKNILKKFDINCKILKWKGKKPSKNIQSIARDKRYELLFKECHKQKINLILTAHQKDDLYENFFIRMLRGSGLKGLSSFSQIITKITKSEDIYILRPLLNFSKKDLAYITKNTFDFHINDPSNYNNNFLRIKLRKMLNQLYLEGLSLNKFKLTLENLYKSNVSIEYYVNQNIIKNSKPLVDKKSFILNNEFFNHPDEIVFRSFSEIIHKAGKKKNYARGNKVSNIIKNFKSKKNFKKVTLSGCVFEKVNNSVIISREI